MEKLKQYKYIILIVLIVLVTAFYWFELRPSQIVKKCSGNIFDQITETEYIKCLRNNGLAK